MNVRGSFLMTKYSLREMKKNDYGRILHLASIAGKEVHHTHVECVCVHVNVSMQVCVQACPYKCVCMRICASVCMQVCVCVQVCVHANVCKCVHASVCVCK